MKALIVDDERHARAELLRLLENFPDIEIVGEAANVPQAREKIHALGPDLVFLDIQMPEENGFELLESLGAHAPKVIFTTAYDAYALRAFDFGAVDYLLKPIAPRRLAVALSRLSEPERGGDPVETEELIEEAAGSPLNVHDRVLLGGADRISYVTVGSIIGAESLGAYSRIWLKGEHLIVRRSLSMLEARLPEEFFMRANRSQLINTQHVLSVETWFSGGLKLTLSGDLTVELSRRQAKLFRQKNTL